ncbi:MAG: regulatory iron-sulfur-containing complex subunit RicT [Ginsengibacter sp.]
MGCTSCGTGKPNGCKGNGGCSSGGCNRLNVHDWLSNLPIDDAESSCNVIEVSFNQGSRKDFYKNNSVNTYSKGDIVAVEGVSGFDVGTVNVTGELVRLQLKKKRIDENSPDIKRILRLASDNDISKWKESKAREREILIRSRAISRQLNLDLKMSEVEIQADSRKATFFYIADDRVDFRELIRIYATEFKVKVEMKQIGARQEAGKVGGIGSCGRELCCSTWLTDFKSVNTNAARYQNLSINQTKLSGQCGRLKCCLNYELDTYLDALQYFPEDADVIEVAKGRAYLIKKDIFRNLMWYSMSDSTKHYPLSIETVKKIKAQNKEGIKPDALETVEIVSGKPKEPEPEFVDVVGQISLKSLDKNSRKQKEHSRRPNAKNTGSSDSSPTSQNQKQQNQRPPKHKNQSPPRGNNDRKRPPEKDS